MANPFENVGPDSRITARVDGEAVVLAASPNGLRSLARALDYLADRDVEGAHTHLHPGLNIEEQSLPLILERLDPA